jgi:SAM-dependent methyltransferase
MKPSAHAEKNARSWNATSAEYQSAHGSQLSVDNLVWGVWSTPEQELGILGDVGGKDILEFGCGGAQWSIGLARRGARMTGLDISEAQLNFARKLVEREGVSVTLVQGSAEDVPLPDQSFDIVFCDHGAMTFCDPRRTVPEASRLLRPGGLFAFNMGTPLLEIAWDAALDGPGERLLHNYFEIERFEEDDMVSFQLPYGEWIRLFRRSGLLIEDLVEIRPREGAESTYRGYAGLQWARRFPAEHIWKLRKEEPAGKPAA